MAYEPILAFDRDSADFALGFEAGAIWAVLNDEPKLIVGQAFHATNSEMLLRMADALEIEIVAEPVDETWSKIIAVIHE